MWTLVDVSDFSFECIHVEVSLLSFLPLCVSDLCRLKVQNIVLAHQMVLVLIFAGASLQVEPP